MFSSMERVLRRCPSLPVLNLYPRTGLDPGCFQPGVVLGSPPVGLLGVLGLGGGMHLTLTGGSCSWKPLLLNAPAPEISFSELGAGPYTSGDQPAEASCRSCR